MSRRSSRLAKNRSSDQKPGEHSRVLSYEILKYANRGIPRIDFAEEVCKILIDFSKCDSVELRLKRFDWYYLCQMSRGTEKYFRVEHLPCKKTEDGRMIPCSQDDSGPESLCQGAIMDQLDPALSSFTKGKSLLIGDSRNLQGFHLQDDFKSLALFPLVVDENDIGLLQLKSKRLNYFTQDEMQFYEEIAHTLGVALVHRRLQVALRERIKELTCLYGIARLAARPDLPLEQILKSIAELLPPAWLYPEIACGKVCLDGHCYATPDFLEGQHNQRADIVVSGETRGFVEVAYSKRMPELDEGPFLREERSLIDAIAREVEIIIERRRAEEEKAKLQNQLMHADRLATIGQLAAGVAHELNEPLGSILGFAQLAKRDQELPKQTAEDLQKIEAASLHAREVVKKLMLFARQMPPQKTQVDLNQLVEEGLYFLESRCAKEGIELVCSLSPGLPEITADRGQLTQVLVNLIVNAVQAMSEGGKLTVRTLAGKQHICLVVEDTGGGMSEEVVKKIFIPFFTTKDLDQGTGLGLPVVHGIVTAHGGSIKVDSVVGQGTRFEVRLPLAGAPDVEENE